MTFENNNNKNYKKNNHKRHGCNKKGHYIKIVILSKKKIKIKRMPLMPSVACLKLRVMNLLLKLVV